ncbi:MAG: methyl-accepting chemotaxis protein [Rhizobacter sp.]
MTTSSSIDKHALADGNAPTLGLGRGYLQKVRALWLPLAVACVAASGALVVGMAGLSPWLCGGTVAALSFFLVLSFSRGSGGLATGGALEASGARLMVGQVVPVWRRQLEMARAATETGFESMLETFARLSQGLSDVADRAEKLSPAQDAGATDQLLNDRPEVIETLLAPVSKVLAQHERVAVQLSESSHALAGLAQMAKDMKGFARHTRMVAMNASIEANRISHERGGGFDAVAKEVRTLGARCDELSEQIHAHVASLNQKIKPLRRDAELQDSSAEEMQLELRTSARLAMESLVGDIGRNMTSSRELREASAQVRDDLDEVLMGFQSGDRVSQMMAILANDMARLADWNEGPAQAKMADATEWLAELDRSYTMEEQRTQHHGNVRIETGTSVDFF